MAYRDLRHYLEEAKERGELTIVGVPLSPRHEIAALLDRASELGLGAVRATAAGNPTPVVGNLACNRGALAYGMGVATEELLPELSKRLANAVDPVPTTDFPTAQIDASGTPLLKLLPLLTHYEGDSAPFITSGLVSAIDPETGAVARGIHRMEYRGPDKLGVALINPPLGTIIQRARQTGEKVRICVSLGLEPVTFLGCALKAPPGVDKLALAGALRGEAVEVAPSPLYGIPVPARSEYLLEGEVDPNEQAPDGPLGEISGYTLTFQATPTMTVRSIRHRSEPIYHALSPAGREADRYLTIVAEATLDPGIAKAHPCLRDCAFVPGTFGSVLVARAAPATPSEIKGLLTRLLTLQMVKKVTIVAEDVDPTDLSMVEWSFATRCQPDRDLLVIPGLKGQPIDPSSNEGFVTAKMGVDATGYQRLGDAKRALAPKQARELAVELLKKECI